MERIKSNIKGLVEEFTVDDAEMLDTTGIVLKFNENVPLETVDWICHLIKKPVLSGGAELDVKRYELEDKPSAQIYIISAPLHLLFIAAEKYLLMKRTHQGTFIPYTEEDKHSFDNYMDDNPDFFTSSEKQFLLKSMLDHVICENENINTIPNFPKVKVYKNRPVLPRCIARNIIEIYPLHHNDSLKPLKKAWYMNRSLVQPLNDIKNYFGESIALYFAFLGFYTKYLIPLAVVGGIHWLIFEDVDKAENVWFAVLNVVWATVFLELWKRERSSIVFEWGRLTSTSESTSYLEKPRAEYKGYPHVSPITGLQEPHYPTWRQRMKMYFVSYPVLLLSLCLATSGMWVYFHFQEHMSEAFKDSTGLLSAILKKIPGIVYAVLIFGLNNGYKKVATSLNDWENHKAQSSYDNHLIIKLILFYFINSFLSLFYIAFYLCDMQLLRQHLATLLITQQFIQQVQESLIPYVKFKKHNIQVKKEGKLIKVKRIRDPKNQVVKEGNLATYSGTFDDYLELFLQFGYVFLFSAAYPLAGFWALVNNIIEIRTDGFKLCKLHQRPFTQPVLSIGVWQKAFELMSFIAVMTNCGIIALSQSTQSWLSMDKKPIKYILLFVVIEHLLIIIKMAIAKLIPDIPGPISKLLAKTEYETQQTLKVQITHKHTAVKLVTVAMFTIGVDVGGTNTDVAIINGTEIIGWSKSSTTEKITDGVVNSIKAAVENAKTNGYENVNLNIKRVNIGTTHFINAVIKRKNLSKVACIRLCGDASRCLPPFVDFPEDLREEVNGGYYMLNGGYQFNEEAISELNEKEIVDTIKIISKAGIEHIAVAGIFSPTNPRQEKIVGEILSQEYSNATYTLSHQLGHLGLLERENAAILNESLKELCLETVVGFKIAIKNIGLSCPVFFTQNDGTLISESQTLKFPVYTFSSGATNSMRGAAHLSSLKDAIIVDIGGTSTDVGVLMKGFPRDASSRVKVGGVNTNFRMPDTKSIGLGGGSIVTLHDDHTCSVGPSSVEYHITEKALIFGGDTLVATDVAVASGRTELGNKSLVSHLTTEFKDRVMSIIQEKVEVAVDTIKLSGNVCPVVLVGGGSILIDTDKPFAGASYVVKPPFYQIANAVGAALSQVSGTIDRLVTLTESNPREKQIESAKLEAIEIAVENGAFRDSCSIVDVSEIQMSYMVLPCVRLHVKAVGDLEVNVAVHSEAKTDVAPKISHKTVPDIKPIQLVGVTETKFASPKQASQLNKPNLTKNGEWIINLWDVDCLAIGAGILGCGGGGSPYLGRLRLKQCVEKGMQVKIVHPKCLKKDEEVYCVAFMGAPEVSHERIINGSELNCALKAAYTLQRHGFRKNMNNDQIKKIAKEKGFEIEITEKNTIVKLPKLDTSGKPAAIMVCEIGGLNAIEPLITGAELGIPILDCDGMGRAFPQLQHFAPFMYGACPYPATVTDLHGNYICCVNVESPTELENFFRQHCVAMGCSAGVCMAPLSSEDIQTRTCLYTLSQAWYLGNSVLSARQLHTCPIEEIMRQTNGKLLCQGKISNLERETKDGFTWGKIDIEGSGTYQNKNFVIEFQNEFIIAKSLQSTLATTPDLITVVDTDMGEPVTTDELKYGLRITALVLPSVPIMNSAKALEFVGPKAFKYENVEYRKACDYVVVESIPQYFGVE